jgi:hypothetical protein
VPDALDDVGGRLGGLGEKVVLLGIHGIKTPSVARMASTRISCPSWPQGQM